MGAVERLVGSAAQRAGWAFDAGVGVRVATRGGGDGAAGRARGGVAAGPAGRLLDRRGDPGPAGGRGRDERGRGPVRAHDPPARRGGRRGPDRLTAGGPRAGRDAGRAGTAWGAGAVG